MVEDVRMVADGGEGKDEGGGDGGVEMTEEVAEEGEDEIVYLVSVQCPQSLTGSDALRPG